MKFRSFKPTGNASRDRAQATSIITESSATVDHCINSGRLSPYVRDDKFRNRIERAFDIRLEVCHTTKFPVAKLVDFIMAEREKQGV